MFENYSIQLVDIDSIEEIELTDEHDIVYDISVEGYETFCTGFNENNQAVLCHNSAMYPSFGQTLNLSPNTYILKINSNEKTLAKWIYEKTISEEDANTVVDIIYKPMTWFGEEGVLGIKQQDKLINVLRWAEDNKYIITVAGAVLNNHSQKLGFHTELLSELREQRDYFRKLEKEALESGDKEAKSRYNKAQTARKLVMNGGYYGSQGTDSFTFFSLGLAESITMSAKVEISYVCYFLEDYIIKSEDKARALAEAEGTFHDIIDDDFL